MAETKVYMEIILNVDGNFTEASKRLCEQIKSLNSMCVCVRDDESYNYKVKDAKITNGIIKKQVNME